ncbi:MAG: hypothetical protein M1833_006140 [Piccolia ochrophora]|nr:MAG: hypothetical protein M1833_006140 [Piccolia ochrophora]
MAKKRKASSRGYGNPNELEVNQNASKLGPITTYEEVADSEDEFLINRDKVLLDEGPDEKRRRMWREEEDMFEPSDEEVLAYSSNASHQSNDDVDLDGGASLAPERPKQMSDPENSAHEEEDEDAGGWGTSKRDYYDADEIDNEADALEEEAEARRLQQKRLQAMSEADFGFDENEWLDSGKGTASGAGDQDDERVVIEVLPEQEITEDMSTEERSKILRTRYPEFDLLANEFLELQTMHDDLSLAAASAEAVTRNSPKPPVAALKYQALSLYLGTLCMYFALLSSGAQDGQEAPKAMSPAELREHAVMLSLVRCREVWNKVKYVKLPDLDTLASPPSDHLTSVERSQQQRLLSNGDPMNDHTLKPTIAEPKKTKKQLALEKAKAESDARRAERLRKTEEELAGLSQLTSKSKPRSTALNILPQRPTNADRDSDYGEETYLDPHTATEKANKKKSLRFYTSQITQKSNKRGQAGRDAGGDTDIPHRERLKDRRARLNAQAENRGQRGQGVDLQAENDDNDDDPALQRTNAAAAADGEDEDYYNLIASHSRARKASSAAAFPAGTAPERHPADTLGPDGKRAISYAIQKNKGLAPRRKKEVRNPRVKKRKRFEDKKKKLESVRPVFKGSTGAYEGEKTGIKRGLVRSVKL